MKQFKGQVPDATKDRAAVKADALGQLLRSKRPAQIDAYIDANMPSLNGQERKIIKTIAKLVIYS